MKSRAAASRRTRSYNQGARAEAAEANGKRVIEAFLERLKNDWLEEITLDKVAADAGVTVQTVVRRFGGKQGLLDQMVRVIGDKVRATRAAPVGDPQEIVEYLLADYEQTGDMIVRLLASEQRYRPLQEFLQVGRKGHREWVEQAFADVIQKYDAPSRRRLTDQLVILTDVYTWQLLRRDMKRSLPETAAIMAAMIRSVIGGFDRPAV